MVTCRKARPTSGQGKKRKKKIKCLHLFQVPVTMLCRKEDSLGLEHILQGGGGPDPCCAVGSLSLWLQFSHFMSSVLHGTPQMPNSHFAVLLGVLFVCRQVMLKACSLAFVTSRATCHHFHPSSAWACPCCSRGRSRTMFSHSSRAPITCTPAMEGAIPFVLDMLLENSNTEQHSKKTGC